MSRRATFEDANEESFVARKRMTGEMELDITPMIDVTFLLLIFFMVSSTMQAEKDREIPQATFAQAIESGKVTVLELAYSGSPQLPPAIVLPAENGKEISLEEVKGVVLEAKAQNKLHVVIRADGRISNGHVDRVARAVVEVEDVQISIGVREKKGG